MRKERKEKKVRRGDRGEGERERGEAHHRYRNVSNIRQKPADLAHDVFPLEPFQPLVEVDVVHGVVVALGEQELVFGEWACGDVPVFRVSYELTLGT